MRFSVFGVSFRWRLLLWGALLLCPAAPGWAQSPPHRDARVWEIQRLAGPVVASAHTKVAEGSMGLAGYRVREVALAAPVTANVAGRAATVSRAWHVTVYFDRALTVRNQAFTLVLDGRPAAFLQESADLRRADAVVFDASLVREGAALGVTYRGVEITRPAPAAEERAAPETQLTGDGSIPIYYSSRPLRLQKAR